MIIVVGVAGSGKSTQSRLLADTEGWCWISMGQLLRDTLTGELEHELNSGKLLDDEKVQAVLLAKLKDTVPHCKVVLDGFPRRLMQANWLLAVIREVGNSIEAIVHLNAHQEVVWDRLLHRGRQDDEPDAITERFKEYENDIKPLLALFSENGVPIIEVNGEQSPEAVQADICDGLTKIGIVL